MDSFVEVIYKKAEEFSNIGFRNIVLIISVIPLLLLVGLAYYYQLTVTDLSKKIKGSDVLLEQIAQLAQINNSIVDVETAEETFLAANVLPSGLEAFVEQKLGSLMPEPGWKEGVKITQWTINPAYEEKRIVVVLKKVSTQQLVEFIQALSTQPAVVVRRVEINKLSDALSCTLEISYRYKKS